MGKLLLVLGIALLLVLAMKAIQSSGGVSEELEQI
jgi:hypothetical protein